MRHFRRRCVPLPFGRARVASTRILPLRVQTLTSSSDAPSRATRSQANLSFHGVEYIVTISSARDDVLSVEVRPRARRANDRRTRVRRPCLPRAPVDDGLFVAAQVIVEIAADAFPRPYPPRRLSKKTMASVGAATSPRDTSRTSPPRRAASRSTASSSRCSSPRRWTTRIPSSSTSSPTPTSRRSRANARARPRAAPPPRPTTSATSSSRTPPSSTACTTPSPCSTRTRPPPTRCAPRWRDSNENAKLAAGVAGGDGGFIAADTTSEDSKSSARRTPNFARRTIRSGRRCGSCSASCRAPPRARRAGAASLRGSTELAEFRSGSGAGSEREENLRAELKAVTTELRLMRRERDDANRAAQAAQTDAANAESSKRRMLARRQKELDAARDDLSRRRETERELRVKVKDLSTQCDGLERRLRASGVNVYHSRPSSRAPSPGRVGYGASSRGDASRPRRESPAGSRAATPSRARGDRTPTPRGSTGFRTPTHARSPSPATRGRSPAAAAASSPGEFDPRVVREKNNATRRGSETARGVSPAARAARRGIAAGNDRGTAREVRARAGRGRRRRRGASGGRRGRTLGRIVGAGRVPGGCFGT